MNNETDDNLDLLDLEDDADLSALPESSPFASPRPKKPWLLMGIGLLVIVIATYIIIRTIGSDSSSSVEVNLDTPEVATITVDAGKNNLVVPSTEQKPIAPVPVPVQVAAPKPVEAAPAKLEPVQAAPGVPVREVSDRKEVTFNPNVQKTAQKLIVKPKPVSNKPKANVSGSWYVQFGSYASRASAELAQKRIETKHNSLFSDKQFVILAAVLPNGTTTYRLRIAFADSKDANGFCSNAKSDGLDCYVAR